MSVESFNPPTLLKPHGYHHAVASTGTRTVYTSGQLGVDAEGKVVGEGYREQGYQAMSNLATVLEAAGASLAQIVHMTIYVVDPTDENLEQLYKGTGAAAKERGAKAVPTTLIGIAMIAAPGALVEINAVAVTD